MADLGILRMEVDCRAATARDLEYPALVNYGHFSAMQIRDQRVRGIAHHLARLDEATRELFGVPLSESRVRDTLRHALGDDIKDASARISVFQPDPQAPPTVMVTLRPPADPPTVAQRLRSAVYERPAPHIKHAGTFGQIYHGELAARAGYDDALLTSPDGVVFEAAIANIGFVRGSAVVWPEGPLLRGITMRLLQDALTARGVPQHRRVIRVGDVAGFTTAFVSNSLGVSPVGRVDDRDLTVNDAAIGTLVELYESVPWDVI